MTLSDTKLIQAMTTGLLNVNPVPTRAQIQPNSIDLRLGQQFKRLADIRTPMHLGNPPVDGAYHTEMCERDGGTWIEPGEFVLAHTIEWVKIHAPFMGMVVGKSSRARMGLQVECAGLVDTGFGGQLTLELFNMARHSIYMPVGITICQLTVHRVDGTVLRPYGDPSLESRYQDQFGATPGR